MALNTATNQLLDSLLSGEGGGGAKAQKNNILRLLIQNYINGQNQAQQSLDIATAPRADAYGNSISYDPATGWKVNTTPETKAILDAQQLEQQRSLTTDAARNRELADASARRAGSADEAFTRAFNNTRFDTPRSEADFIGQDQKHNAFAANSGTSNAAAIAASAALRGGDTNDFTKVFDAARSVGDTTDVLGSGTRTGRAAAQQYSTTPDQRFAEFLSGLSGQGQTVPLANPSVGTDLSSLNSQFLSALLQTQQGNTASMNTLLGPLIQALQVK